MVVVYMKKIIFSFIIIFVSSMYGFQRLGRVTKSAADALPQAQKAMGTIARPVRSFSFGPSSSSEKIKTFLPKFAEMKSPGTNFVASAVSPVIKGSFFRNVRDLATQLWHKFGVVERYLFPVSGVRVLKKDRQFAAATEEVAHSIIKTEKEYERAFNYALDDESKMQIINQKLDSITELYNGYATQISSFPYNEISYLKIVIYHVYTAKLLYQMKRDIFAIASNAESIFELQGHMDDSLGKINSELKRLQEFFDNQYQEQRKTYDEKVVAGIMRVSEEPKRVLVYSDDIDFSTQFNESSVLQYFMEKIFNTHDCEVVSLVLKNTVWLDREKNDFYQKIKATKDVVEKIKISIEKLRELKDKNNFNESQKGLLLGMIDKEFCKKERDQLIKEIKLSMDLFIIEYSEKMTEESQKLFSSCQKDSQAKALIMESLKTEIGKLKTQRRKFSNASTQLEQEPYLDPYYAAKVINRIAYDNKLKLLEQLEMIAE